MDGNYETEFFTDYRLCAVKVSVKRRGTSYNVVSKKRIIILSNNNSLCRVKERAVPACRAFSFG